MVIAVDFDGTCVTHEFPKVGKEIGAAPVLKCLTENGHQLILLTMRSHLDDSTSHAHNTLSGDSINIDTLQEAIDWFTKHDIPLYGINENPDQKRWTSSPKVYANLYIDDCNIVMPLVHDDEPRPYVSWWSLTVHLALMGLITKKQYYYLNDLFLNHSPKVGCKGPDKGKLK